MHCFTKVFLLILTSAALAVAADDNLIESTRAREDVALTTYPVAAFWQGARPVYAEKESARRAAPALSHGNPHPLDERQSLFFVCLPLRRTESQALALVLQRKHFSSGIGMLPKFSSVRISRTSDITKNSKFLRKASGSISISIWPIRITKMVGRGIPGFKLLLASIL